MGYKTTNILWLTNTVRKNIQKEKLFHSWHNLLITLSGGQDSAFCLLILYLLRNKSEKKVPFSLCTTSLKPSFFKTLDTQHIRELHKPSYTKADACTKTKFLQAQLLQRVTKAKAVHVPKRSFGLQSLYKLKQKLCFCHAPCTCVRHKSKSFCLRSFCEKKKVIQKRSFYNATQNKALFQQDKGLCIKRKDNLIWYEKNPIIDFYLTFSFVTSYTLLWCNHFWQKDAFFTMEHVSKLAFSKGYTIHLFVPVQQALSEQNARDWRHKIMQRSSFFICQPKFCYELQQSSSKKKEQLKQDLIASFTQAEVVPLNTALINLYKPCANDICTRAVLTSLCNPKQSFAIQSLFSRNEVMQKLRFCNAFKGLFVQQTERMGLFRAQIPLKLKSGQFGDLFLSFVLLARPLLLTLIRKKTSTLVKHINQSHVTKTTFGLSELLCVQGHNKSDRAEAILFNLIRGAGINGISTLQWKQTLNKAKFSYSNQVFYPIFSDFLKEIVIIHLDIFECKREKSINKTDKDNNLSKLAILQKIIISQKRDFYSQAQQGGHNRKNKALDFEELNYNCTSKNFAVNAQTKTSRQGSFWVAKLLQKQSLYNTLQQNKNIPQSIAPRQKYRSWLYLGLNKTKFPYAKKADFRYKRVSLQKTESIDFNHQNKVKIKMFYYELKYKQNMFFYS